MQFHVKQTGESAGEDELDETGHGRDKCARKVHVRVRQRLQHGSMEFYCADDHRASLHGQMQPRERHWKQISHQSSHNLQASPFLMRRKGDMPCNTAFPNAL